MPSKIEKAVVTYADTSGFIEVKTLVGNQIIKGIPLSVYKAGNGKFGFFYFPNVGDQCLVFTTEEGDKMVGSFYGPVSAFNIKFPVEAHPGDMLIIFPSGGYILFGLSGTIRLVAGDLCKVDLIPELGKELVRIITAEYEIQSHVLDIKSFTDDYGAHVYVTIKEQPVFLPTGNFVDYTILDDKGEEIFNFAFDKLHNLDINIKNKLKIKLNSSTGEYEVEVDGNANLKCKNAKIECDNAKVISKDTTLESDTVNLTKEPRDGIVTGSPGGTHPVCYVTGAPILGSNSSKSGK